MSNSGRLIHLRSSARTSTGQVRQNNEDNVHLWSQDGTALAIVADGMGGAAAGEEASRLAVESIHESLFAKPIADVKLDELAQKDNIAELLHEAVTSANLKIMERARDNPEFKGMGTTVTMSFIDNTTATIAHVGDSRAYLIDGMDGSIDQVTNDHSFVQALLNAGHITPEQAEEHPMRNVLYRALGQAKDLDVDIYYVALRVGDRMVLCSDGLTRHVEENEIAEAALADEDPGVSSQRLIDLTNERGGEDNVSVIVITVERGPDAPETDRQTYVEFSESDTVDLRAFRAEVKGNDPRETGEMPGSPNGEIDVETQSQQVVIASDNHTLASKMRAERDNDRIATGESEVQTNPAAHPQTAEASRSSPLNPERASGQAGTTATGLDDNPAEGYDRRSSDE